VQIPQSHYAVKLLRCQQFIAGDEVVETHSDFDLQMVKDEFDNVAIETAMQAAWWRARGKEDSDYSTRSGVIPWQ
jgi:hypothetical protein